MAFNPSPKVAAARNIGTQFGKTRVIVLMLDDDNETIEYASWGINRELCKSAKLMADILFEEAMERSKAR